MPLRFAAGRPLPVALLTAVVLLVALVGATRASAAIQLGAYSAAPGHPSAMEDSGVLDDYIAKVGRAPAILHDYSNVTDPLFTASEVENIASHGVTPMVTWQLFKSGYGGASITLPDIAAGRYDTELRDAARMAGGLPFEVLIRFAHEMNGDWYPWRPGGEAGNTGSNYVDAWRHIVSVFRAEGAANVKWVWSPNVDYGDYPFAQYFPGDEWVDWVALDGYNWGTGGVGVNRWQSLAEVFLPSYAELTRLSSKPVMIAETSSSEAGGDKAAWTRAGLLKTIPEQMPRVGAVLWFDRDMEQDWRIDSSSSSLAAFREVASSTTYGGDVAVPVPGEETAAGGKKGKGGGKGKTKTLRSLRVTRKVTADTAGSGLATVSGSQRPVKRARHSRVRGRIVYRLTRPARVRIAIEGRQRRGFSRRLVSVRAGARGANRVSFRQLRRRLHLRPGVYRVSVKALDGNRGEPRRAGFRVVRSHGR